MQLLKAHYALLADKAADWLIVGVREMGEPGDAGKALDAKMGGTLSRLLEWGDNTGKAHKRVALAV